MFYSGQKVVCVDAEPLPGRAVSGITEGDVYTVRWCGFYSHPLCSGEGVCIRLLEVSRPVGFDPDLPYLASRFRPLCSRPTSIEVFKRLLVPSVSPMKERT